MTEMTAVLSHLHCFCLSPFLLMETRIPVFWDGTLCQWVGSSWCFKDHSVLSFRFTILSNCTPNGTATRPRCFKRCTTPPWVSSLELLSTVGRSASATKTHNILCQVPNHMLLSHAATHLHLHEGRRCYQTLVLPYPPNFTKPSHCNLHFLKLSI
jgi:hypothetical protein